MNAPLPRHHHTVRQLAVAGLLSLGLFFALPGAQGPIGPDAAHALTAQEKIEKAMEKDRVRKLLEPYSRDVRKAIRQEYKRLGKGPGAIEAAIRTVVTTGGGGNSAVKRDAFAQTVFPIVRNHCKECHAGAGPGFPSIAHPTVTTAYDSIVSNQKVHLSDPVRSRIVQRLSSDRHYCWSNCSDDGDDMRRAVAEWAAIEESVGSGVDVNAIASTSSSMAEGIVDKQKGRIVDHVIAKWEFKKGEGEIARDTSNVEPTMDLELHNTEWLSNWGLDFESRSWAIADAESSRKLYKRIAHPEKGTQQYSIEAWVAPANIDQDGPARIVSYSNGTSDRNFMLGQNTYNYVFRNRNKRKRVDANGSPDLVTDDDDQDAQPVLQHVVVTYDRLNGRKVFVNGRFTGDKDPVKGDFLINWDKDFRFVVGNETSLNRQWEGQMRYLAIHEVALSKKQIKQNYKQGVGQRFLVSFGLDDWLATTGNAVRFTVREFDNYSYLFCEPSFTGPPPLDYTVQGMTISVNGVEAATGQAFANLDVIVASDGKSVSRLCSIIAKDQGPDLDRFSISFKRLGDFQNVTTEDPPVVVVPEDDTEFRPVIGVRTFDEINLSMAALTGVPATDPDIEDVFGVIRQALPATADPQSFQSSHQVAVSKLALEYCHEMVESPVLRDQFFGVSPGVDFDSDVPAALGDPAQVNVVVHALFDNMVGAGLSEQPTRGEVTGVLRTLIADLTAGCDAATCPAERTRTVVKAACAAVLSSAAVALH
ncbi:MAG: LamG-like jellyroll fold domain-containing protein [Myxococcota bacterium]